MDSLVESLSQSFTVVPPTAVPAMLDCVVASTGLSHMSLFSSFLSAFPNLSKVLLLQYLKITTALYEVVLVYVFVQSTFAILV